MKLTGPLETAINDQVTLEVVAALTYEQLAIDMEALDLPGIASWFRAQADEERVHAGKFIAHMLDRDAHPRYGEMTVEAETATTVLAAFEAALAHEQKVSGAIRDLYKIAQEQGDVDSLPLLHWFISEQVEEEATVSEIIAHAKLIGEDGTGLLKLDAQLGTRPGGELPVAE